MRWFICVVKSSHFHNFSGPIAAWSTHVSSRNKMLSLLMSTPCVLSGGRRAVLKSGSSFALGALALRTPAVSAADELPKVGGKPVMAQESIMSQKAHGTSASPVQANLKWDVDGKKADQITNFNRRFAEYGGYWKETSFLKEVSRDEPTTYYDSVTGKPLFVAPIGRTMDQFLAESNVHGWPSFRDSEVVWENTRGTHGQTGPGSQQPVRPPSLQKPRTFAQGCPLGCEREALAPHGC